MHLQPDPNHTEASGGYPVQASLRRLPIPCYCEQPSKGAALRCLRTPLPSANLCTVVGALLVRAVTVLAMDQGVRAGMDGGTQGTLVDGLGDVLKHRVHAAVAVHLGGRVVGGVGFEGVSCPPAPGAHTPRRPAPTAELDGRLMGGLNLMEGLLVRADATLHVWAWAVVLGAQLPMLLGHCFTVGQWKQQHLH